MSSFRLFFINCSTITPIILLIYAVECHQQIKHLVMKIKTTSMHHKKNVKISGNSSIYSSKCFFARVLLQPSKCSASKTTCESARRPSGRSTTWPSNPTTNSSISLCLTIRYTDSTISVQLPVSAPTSLPNTPKTTQNRRVHSNPIYSSSNKTFSKCSNKLLSSICRTKELARASIGQRRELRPNRGPPDKP